MCSKPTTQCMVERPCWHAWVYSQRTCSWPCGPHRYRHGKSAGIVYWGQHLPQASPPSPRASPPPPACPSSEYSGRRRGICVPSPHLRDNVYVTSQHATGKEVYWTLQQRTTSSIYGCSFKQQNSISARLFSLSKEVVYMCPPTVYRVWTWPRPHQPTLRWCVW